MRRGVGLEKTLETLESPLDCKEILEIDGETVETVSDFSFGGSKITTDGDCSHEIKRL